MDDHIINKVLELLHYYRVPQVKINPSGKTKLCGYKANVVYLTSIVEVYMYGCHLSVYNKSERKSIRLPNDNINISPCTSHHEFLEALSELYEILTTQFYI